MATGLIDGLNEKQREAVTASDGPMLVLAGPGSGKTRVLTHRIAFLIEEMGVAPDNIVAVTFTNKAAGEMRLRVEKLLRGAQSGLTIGTFHAICARLLRREHQHHHYGADYAIYDTDDQVTLVTQAMAELEIDIKKYSPRMVLGMISGAKNELITPDEYVGSSYTGEIVRRTYPRYQAMLQDNNAMDFDDLLMNMVLLLRENNEVRAKYQRIFQHILVDEFQDTNTAQYQLVRLIAPPQNNAFVVGDEDQAIYAFRGADYRNVMNFRKDFSDARVILLEDNYRSTQIVLDVARAVIDKNVHRTPKRLHAARGESGRLITVYEAYDQDDEAQYIVQQVRTLRSRFDCRDMAVMYRTNAQSRALEDAFVAAGIPHRVIGTVGFYKRREVKDLLAYLRLVQNPSDTISFGRVINTPKRGIGKKSLEEFMQWASDEHISYGEALERLMNGEKTPLGSKGKAYADFGRMLTRWRDSLTQEGGNLLSMFDELRAELGIALYLRDISQTEPELREREENVEELRNLIARDKDKPLAEFLNDVALVSEVDALREDADAVTLMTLHAAKGLEYPIVFLSGLEEGLLPHIRSKDDPEQMEEERRLLYVGVTRAKEQVYITYAFRRMVFGSSITSVPSRFLSDVPEDLTEGLPANVSASAKERSYQEMTRWDRSEPVRPNPKIVSFNAPPAKPLNFRMGQRVHHDKLGDGIVQAVRRSGDDEEVTVQFEKVGTKVLLASMARLTVLKG